MKEGPAALITFMLERVRSKEVLVWCFDAFATILAGRDDYRAELAVSSFVSNGGSFAIPSVRPSVCVRLGSLLWESAAFRCYARVVLAALASLASGAALPISSDFF